MPKSLHINDLERIAIIGVGLLGGSIGLALRAAGFAGQRVGIGRRASSLKRALEYDAVDEVTLDPAEGVAGAELTILCTPIGRFEKLLAELRPGLGPDCFVTDVGSTKAEVVRIARQALPRNVHFVGSHPMAGSEKTGVEFARADLFQDALCIVTPTARTPDHVVRAMTGFWESLGARSQTLSPTVHDRLLARVSHLPHAVATALVSLSTAQDAIELAGPGFADATRIASGDPGMWTDILRTNRPSMIQAIDRLVRTLGQLRDRLDRDDAAGLEKWLRHGKDTRDAWVARQYKRKQSRRPSA